MENENDKMIWKEKDGTTLEVTRWSKKLYKVLWVAAILAIAFSIIGIGFFLYEFWRLDNMNVFDKVGEITNDLKAIERAIIASGGCR